MTAAEVAAALGARRSGPGRWRARCPSHNDRNPSLSIAEGDAGRVLLHCWAGCETMDVLGAAGLSYRSICGTTSPTERARMRREREQRDAAEAVARDQQQALAELLRQSDTTLDAIGERLAVGLWRGAPEDADALTAQYHRLVSAQRVAEGVDPWA